MCLDDQILNTYLDGELAEPWKTQVAEHLNYCSACNTRFEQLRSLHAMVSGAKLAQEEIQPHQRKVLQFIEKNYLEKQRKVGFFHRDFHIKTPIVLSTAAAFIVVFAGALMIGQTSQPDLGDLIPQVVASDGGSVVQVRATENLAASQVLDSLSLEEILKYLDSRGYEVDLRLKGLQPIGEELETSSEVVSPIEDAAEGQTP